MFTDEITPVQALDRSFRQFLGLLSNKLNRAVPAFVPTFALHDLQRAEDDVLMVEEHFHRLMEFLLSNDPLFSETVVLKSGMLCRAKAQVFIPGLSLDFDVIFSFAGSSVSVEVVPRNLKYAHAGTIIIVPTAAEFLSAVSKQTGVSVANLLKDPQVA